MDIQESERHAVKLMEREEFHDAERLLTSLADQGSTYAMMALAWIYENGCLGSRNVRAAQYYYEQAISAGIIEALFDLGLLFLKEERADDAQRLFERGAEKGHTGCSVELGWMLANGAGGGNRKAEGRKMLESASRRGHLFAQRRIISLDSSDNPSLFKKIFLFGRIIAVAWKTFFELYRNRRSNKIW